MKISSALAGLLLAAVTALSSASAAEFRLAFKGDLKSLDPYSLNEIATLGLLGNVYEGLVSRGRNLELQPGLAESWETPEPTRWRFHLRHNVKFQNGEDFTADDVVFSAGRVRADGSNLKSVLPADAKVVAVDRYTVDFILTAPNPILPAEWETWYIMSRKWAQANGAEKPQPLSGSQTGFAAMHANGTGAFAVAEHQPGIKTVFKPYTGWHEKPVHNFDTVTFTTIGNNATRVAALLAGDVDFIDPVPLQDIERLKTGGMKVLTGPELRTMFLGFDTRHDELPGSDVKGRNPFKDVRVRRAVALAVDEEAIRTKIMRGNAVVSSTMITPMLSKEAAAVTRWKTDPAAAKALLAEAGYLDGFSVRMACTNDRYVADAAICAGVTSMLAKIGIRVTFDSLPKAKFFAEGDAGTLPLYLLGWVPVSLESNNVFANIVGCPDGKARGSYNYGGYCNPAIEDLSKRIAMEADTAKRNAMIGQAWTILHDDVATVPLHQQTLAWGVDQAMTVDQRPDNLIRFRLFSKKTTVGQR